MDGNTNRMARGCENKTAEAKIQYGYETQVLFVIDVFRQQTEIEQVQG